MSTLNNNVINEVFTDLQKGNFDHASGLLSDDFKTNVLGNEVGKDSYISTYRALMKGIPDMNFHVQDVNKQGDKLTARVLMSGTNNQTIPALMNGWKQIPATNKKLNGVVANLEITMTGDKIAQIKSAQNGKGIFVSLMESLGLDHHKLHAN